MKQIVIIHHYPYSDVKDFYREESNSRRKQRLLAVLLLYEGKTIPEVALCIHVAATSVRLWIHRWNTSGLLGLFLKKSPGRPSKLTGDQASQTIAKIEESPTKVGYDTEQWSLKAISHYIETELKKK